MARMNDSQPKESHPCLADEMETVALAEVAQLKLVGALTESLHRRIPTKVADVESVYVAVVVLLVWSAPLYEIGAQYILAILTFGGEKHDSQARFVDRGEIPAELYVVWKLFWAPEHQV